MAQHAGCGLVGRVLEQRAVFHRNVAGGKAENGKSAYHPINRLCFGFNFPDSAEPLAEGHNRLVVDRVMLTPRSWVDQVGSRDRFRLPDEETPNGWPIYEVQGVPGSAKYNPLRWHPGGVVLLQRVDG